MENFQPFWSPWNWGFNQANLFWQIAASISTTVTLFILVYTNWKARKDIRDLSGLIKSINEQNHLLRLDAKRNTKPKIKIVIGPVFIDNYIFSATKIINEGEQVTIKKIILTQGITLKHKPSLPVTLGYNMDLPLAHLIESDKRPEIILFVQDEFGCYGISAHYENFKWETGPPSELEEIPNEINLKPGHELYE